MSSTVEACDVLVIGGGINGTGIARDAAGRGLLVVLCERDDLAGHTSSASTKLIHGGLRYLEHYEFGLVRKALREREVLLRCAPHIISPLRFVMPHEASTRPAWLIRSGLFLYDHLARRELLPGSEGIALGRHPAGAPLLASWKRGFEYSDGWVDDARLVVLNAMAAREHGARIHTHTACTALTRREDGWHARLRGRTNIEIRARAVVNAAGPWAGELAGLARPDQPRRALRLIKGSHIVVPRLFEHEYAYLFQNADRRVVFAIPYERDFTLIGTTDLEYQGDARQVAIDHLEVRYLCQLANQFFQRKIGPQDVVWSYSGVRPLLDDSSGDASAITRDYLLELKDDGPPLLHVWGGKITTYRKLAEEAMTLLTPRLGMPDAAWTARVPLPGGDLDAPGQLAAKGAGPLFLARLKAQFPWLPADLAQRYARCYGSRALAMLDGADSLAGLGEELTPGLHAREARYLVDQEWARDAADLLWRRTKLGLRCTPTDVQRLASWLGR